MLILSVPLVLVQIYYPQSARSVTGFVEGNFWMFTAVRLFLIAVIFLIWPVCIQRFAKNHEWIDAKTQFWIAQRFRITAWMMIIEILICQNLLFHLL